MIFDVNKEFKEILEKVKNILTPRELTIIRARNNSNGEKQTLEAVGIDFGNLTRERIRQINKKATEKLNQPYIKNHILLVVSKCFETIFPLFRKKEFKLYDRFYEPSYVSYNEALSLIDHDVFYAVLDFYLALTENKSRIRISTKYKLIFNSFCINEEDAALNFADIFKPIISQDEFELMDETQKSLLINNYNFKHNVYVRKGIKKRDLILEIVDEEFTSGYHISNVSQYNRFKQIYESKYESKCTIKQREIVSAMENSKAYCQIGRGLYLRFDKCSKLPDNLLDDIISFIFEYGGTMYYSTIFNQFRKELEEIGVKNWFYLKGVLDKQSEGMFYTRRATLSVNSTKQFEDPIRDYIINSSGVVTMQELRNKFPGVKDYLFLFRIFGNTDIIALDNGKFIYYNSLHLQKDDIKTIRDFVMENVQKSDYEISTSRVLYPLLKINFPELCLRLGVVNDQFSLFSLCNYLLEDELTFSRPYIAKKGTEDLTVNKILARYIEDFLPIKFNLQDLDNYLVKYNTSLINRIGFVEEMAEKYLLINDKEFIKINEIDLENVNQIRDFLIFTVSKFNEIRISNFTSYFLIPKNKYIYWNKLTLFSFINAFCADKLEIELVNNSFDNIDYIIRRIDE